MKAKITIGYKQWVLDHDKAIQLVTLLGEAECYESEYQKDVGDGKGSYTTHYVYPQEEIKTHSLELIPDTLYAMWKLAGKPTKEK